jgi:hypothetical protein
MFRIVIALVVIGMVLAGVQAVEAQQPKGAAVSPAPVPTQILSGKRVFISNAGEENLNTLIGPVFSGRYDRVYNQFYAAIKQWGRYEPVSAPAEADLVFEIGFTISGTRQLPEIGHLRLAIRDPKTNVLLWSIVEYAQVATLKRNRDKNLDQAMGTILDELKDLTR